MDRDVVSKDAVNKAKYEILRKKYDELAKKNERLAEQVFQTKRMVAHLQKRRFRLVKRLENHGDDFRSKKRKFIVED